VAELNGQAVFRFFTEVGIIDQLMRIKLEGFLPGRMSATQFGLLGHLIRRPDGETPQQLASAFQVPKTSMTHMLMVLEEQGFVDIAPNPEDGRSKIVCATESGARFQGEVTGLLAQEMRPMVQELGFEGFAEAIPFLVRLREVLDHDRD
jgi:DNA-binding MarR family transcriptional regulator